MDDDLKKMVQANAREALQDYQLAASDEERSDVMLELHECDPMIHEEIVRLAILGLAAEGKQ